MHKVYEGNVALRLKPNNMKRLQDMSIEELKATFDAICFVYDSTSANENELKGILIDIDNELKERVKK
jgi:hypothetical protein